MPRNYNTPVFSRLDEIASIEFNTGVSTFTKNLNNKFVFEMYNFKYELTRCLKVSHRRPRQIWYPDAGEMCSKEKTAATLTIDIF